MVLILIAAYTDFLYAWNYQSFVDGPLELLEWPPSFAVFFGLTLFTVRLWVHAVRSTIAVINDTGTATMSRKPSRWRRSFSTG